MGKVLGERIKKLRKEKNITQKELAKILNIQNSTLSQYENGINEPSDEIKIKIADFFNVSIDYLLGRTDNPNPNNSYKLTDEEADKLADEIIEIYIKKGKIKRGEKLTPEKIEKILKEIEIFIDMANKLEDI
ncbi:helix-turn-helix domain-containing protein [Caloranaerobacter ferrireducens]|uniref:helix-turn-helix domain-containing protein n=1 Tax=Caloranaerobacter ferrireducens TaxID=1323370 RepID=UPI00084D5627|nr:helix-turn-helix domain-containing protein [Caloranaerobacter ferrireducens]